MRIWKRCAAGALCLALAAGTAGCGRTVSAEGRDAGRASDLPVVAEEPDMAPLEPVAVAMAGPGAAVLDAPVREATEGDPELEAVTAEVKEKLGLDTSGYDFFRGEEQTDALESRWSLEWSNGDGSGMSVLVNGDGLVLRYRVYEADGKIVPYGASGGLPSFPKGDAGKAYGAAKAFAGKCLADGETLSMPAEPVGERLGDLYYDFHGGVMVNGIPAGIGCDVTVRMSDNAVTSFSRTDWRGMVRDDVPEPGRKTERDAAAKLFLDTVEMDLEWVLPADGSKKAYLAYVPVAGDTYYVDDATGELVDLTELAAGIGAPLALSWDDTSAKAMDAMENSVGATADGGRTGLTEAELAGSARMAGVLSGEDLDKAVSGVEALGLGGYVLAGVDYFVSDLSGEDAEDLVTARMTYATREGGWRRAVTVDARTGDILSVYSNLYADGSDEAASLRKTFEADAKAAAEAFLDETCGKQAAKCALDGSSMPGEGSLSLEAEFTFVQEEAGHPFRGNVLRVAVDLTDGSVSRYVNGFDDEVSFGDPDGSISEEEAAGAWLDTYDVTFRYVQVPFALDASAPEYRTLVDAGVAYMYKLVPGWTMERTESVDWIRADDGGPVRPSWLDDGGYEYSDVGDSGDGSMILALARYGVGLDGGRFDAGKALTDADLEALLDGMFGDGYGIAWRDGHGASAGKPARELSRGEAVKLAVSRIVPEEVLSWGFGDCSAYADEDDIPAGMRQVAAIAAACGMVDPEDGFDADGPVTRGEMAAMLYKFLDR